MPRVNASTWTVHQDRTLLLQILWQSNITLREWNGVTAAMGEGFTPTICHDRYKLLISHLDFSLENADETLPSPGPLTPTTSQTVPNGPANSVRQGTQVRQSARISQGQGSMQDLDGSEPEPTNSQPKGKKRKSSQGGRASTAAEVAEDDGEDADGIESEQLRTPHGQRTSNISFTRTNTVQKIFAPAASKALPTASGALPPNGPARVAGQNQSSTQQANTRRQQTQQAPSQQETRNENSNANSANGQGTDHASNNVARGQSNNVRGRGRGRGGQQSLNRGNHRQNANTNSGRHQRFS